MITDRTNEARTIHNLPINDSGVFLIKTPAGERATNVPWSVIEHSPDGFAWGYGGSGPADLALNILEYAIEELNLSGDERKECFIGNCSAEAWRLHQKFKELFLVNEHHETTIVIDWMHIASWLCSHLDIHKLREINFRRLIGYYIPRERISVHLDHYGPVDNEQSTKNILQACKETIIEHLPSITEVTDITKVEVRQYWVEGSSTEDVFGNSSYEGIVTDTDDEQHVIGRFIADLKLLRIDRIVDNLVYLPVSGEDYYEEEHPAATASEGSPDRTPLTDDNRKN